MNLNFELENRLFEEASGEPDGGTPLDGDAEESGAESEESTDEEEEESSGEADDISDDEIKEAKNLYKLLKDPSTNKDVLRVLAGKAGLLAAETPKEAAKATRKVADILKSKLGDKFDFLTPMLAEALEEILQDVKAENASQIGAVQQTQLNNDVQSAFAKLSSETKGASKNLESKMAALSEKFPPGENITVEEYVRGLYAMASSGAGKSTNAKQIADRINRNIKDVPGRLASRSSGAGKDSPRSLGKMNLNQAVEHAMNSLGMKK